MKKKANKSCASDVIMRFLGQVVNGNDYWSQQQHLNGFRLSDAEIRTKLADLTHDMSPVIVSK